MTQKITKILIANRGEIACRVIKTARKMGIATVAVYSDADRKALHVRLADEAVHIGPSPAVESYLVIKKIIKAAKETGADAVHPGYGFLSENPDFVRACEKAKITFIGPSAEAMEAMGLKDAAKKLMDEAGVPITPGYHGKDQSPKLLKAKAGMIGYPVLIKAVAGGGGKGMRKVEADKDFDAALASCQREAASSFGNEDVLIEKYIQSPRHIEVQIFGDTHGNVVHMFERDCSLQRRHQKVIEEAPAPGMTDPVRKAMTDAAIKAAKAVDYVGAGTVEFIVDGSGKLKKDGFWFMEMNTRLQVEHPVTEMITGLDLVEWQIRVARGEKLPKQSAIKISGHAVEARIYAEDPANDFLPSIGRVTRIAISDYVDESIKVRMDTGVAESDPVSVFYDPMIMKYIVQAETREIAIKAIRDNLEWSSIEGVTTNSEFLVRLLNLKDFVDGNPTTHLIPAHIDYLVNNPYEFPTVGYAHAAVSVLKSLERTTRRRDRIGTNRRTPFDDLSAFRMNQSNFTQIVFEKEGSPVPVYVSPKREGWQCVVGTETVTIIHGDADDADDDLSTLQFSQAWDADILQEQVELRRKGKRLIVPLLATSGDQQKNSSDAITAPMPGKIIALNCGAGDAVSEGDALVVMEAMKMEQTLTAPRDGVVAEVGAAVGELVTDGTVLVRLEEAE